MKSYSTVNEMIDSVEELIQPISQISDYWKENKFMIFVLRNGFRLRLRLPF